MSSLRGIALHWVFSKVSRRNNVVWLQTFFQSQSQDINISYFVKLAPRLIQFLDDFPFTNRASLHKVNNPLQLQLY